MTKRPKRRVSVPEGCTDIWRVSEVRKNRWKEVGIYTNEDYAYSVADKIMKHNGATHVSVAHKAAIMIGDKTYLVNVLPIRVNTSVLPDTEHITPTENEEHSN